MYTYREQLEILKPIRLKEGETKRLDCPFCGGKGTFTFSNRDGRKVWNCYKASCPVSGSTETAMSSETIKKRLLGISAVGREAPKYELPVRLSDPVHHPQVMDYLSAVGSTEAYQNGWIAIKYAPAENRVLFYNKENIGAVGRSLDGRKPKWKVYGDTTDLFTVGSGPIAVVVEDAASACSVARLSECSGCALLGTSVKVVHKVRLRLYERVVIALDKDASKKAVEMLSKLSGLTDVRVALLDDDLKYLSVDAIRRKLKI